MCDFYTRLYTTWHIDLTTCGNAEEKTSSCKKADLYMLIKRRGGTSVEIHVRANDTVSGAVVVCAPTTVDYGRSQGSRPPCDEISSDFWSGGENDSGPPPPWRAKSLGGGEIAVTPAVISGRKLAVELHNNIAAQGRLLALVFMRCEQAKPYHF
ncbi:hypothetical protein Bbelb_111420 [Branchiostoma belcheri]|nr:hypothetical protein Bbelb_111420 [Branchiostoma belcheri]